MCLSGKSLKQLACKATVPDSVICRRQIDKTSLMFSVNRMTQGWFTLKADAEKSSGKAESAKKKQSKKLVHTKSGKRKKTPNSKIFRALRKNFKVEIFQLFTLSASLK